MSYSLLAHLYPRIKGSQEDVATFSLAFILEQSPELNEAFTRLICGKMGLKIDPLVHYNCQDSDPEYGRPDIAGYKNGELRILCEAKFYAGLTDSQPVAYIKRLFAENGNGLIFICPKNRKISLWDKVCKIAKSSGLQGSSIKEYCMAYDNVRMSVITWPEILAELKVVAKDRDPDRQGDVEQLQGFYDIIESESFIPFRSEDFGAQVARDIKRYNEAVEATYKKLKTDKRIRTSSEGLRFSPYIGGFSRPIMINDIFVGITFNLQLWSSPSSVETPFWVYLLERNENGKLVVTEKVNRYMASIDKRHREWFYRNDHIALEPKPLVTLEELAEDMAEQIIEIVKAFEVF